MRRIVVRGDNYNYVLRIDNKTINLYIGKNKFIAEYDRRIEDVSEIYFQLMVYILMYNMDNVHITAELPKNNYNNGLISYSGGADSTALYVLTNDIPVHIERFYQPKYEKMQMRAVNAINAIIIKTDFEKVRQLIKGKHGFNIGTGYACMYMPLVEIMQINRIGFGIIFEDFSFNYSEKLKFNQNFENTGFNNLRNFMLNYNIELKAQLAGYSEYLALNIAKYSNIPFSSCHTGDIGQACGVCYKCFRKQALLGNPLSLCNPKLRSKVMTFMQKKPLKMAASTIFAVQKAQYPEFSRFFDLEMSWITRINKSLTEQFGGDLSQRITYFHTEIDIENINKFVDFMNQDFVYNY